VSGSIPCDIVRLPCGSMSTHSTRWPSSAKATARLSVVVVLATPPFWLANAITLALTGGSDASGDSYAPVFAPATPIPPDGGLRSVPAPPPGIFRPRVATPRQTAAVRHRQGRRGEVDGVDRAR